MSAAPKPSENIVNLETRVDQAWERYVTAASRAQRSLDIRDGIEAGRAWAAFLAEFNRTESTQ